MADGVRLVIWDLDETFWTGTLTEGGITYRPDCHDIVIELARRGIMSTICSKNDLAPVRAELEARGIWDHFIFPSVNWEPKGPRIAALIETVQLRAPNVMLIDDNAMNLNEARHFVPDIQTEAETFIPDILADPRFRGKDDAALTRLAQYKTLERRHAEEVKAVAATGSNQDFLRESGITVHIEYDLDDKIDRIVELVNRTNQMNFTKLRFAEDPAEAAAEARALIAQYDIQAGLLRVTDRYGDYGYAGFYAMTNRALGAKLQHFCFSCRILNMGVEQWLYRRLHRPKLKIAAPVSSNPFDESISADWISVAVPGAPEMPASDSAPTLGTVAIRGGCNLAAVGHYFRGSAKALIEEYNTARDNHGIRIDHSHLFRMALEGVNAQTLRALEKIGYVASDFTTAFASLPPDSLILLSFTTDCTLATYRHRRLGFQVPFWRPKKIPGTLSADITVATPEELDVLRKGTFVRAAIETLQRDYIWEGPISRDPFMANVHIVLERLPATATIAVLGASEHRRSAKGEMVSVARARDINTWTRQVIADFPNAYFVDAAEFILKEEEIDTIAHYNRMVYFRIYQHLIERLGGAAEKTPLLQLAS